MGYRCPHCDCKHFDAPLRRAQRENDELRDEIARLKTELAELRDVDLHSAHERIKDIDELLGETTTQREL